MSIVEVARAAGVSHATVSRVINNSPSVSADSVRAVNAAMRQIGYTPPARRRGPRPKHTGQLRTGNIAMLLLFEQKPTLVFAPVTAAFVHAAEEALREQGLSFSLSQVNAAGLPATIKPDRIDGLLLHGQPPSGDLAEQIKRFPFVWCFSRRTQHGDWGDRVSPDNEAIGVLAAQYLLERGHRRVAILNSNPYHLGFMRRRETFVQMIAEAGGSVQVVEDEKITGVVSHQEEQESRRLEGMVERLLQSPDRPTGLFVSRARCCVTVYRALRARNIEPGRDVDVVTCDVDPMLEGLEPRPATVDVMPEELARRAVDQLLHRIRKPADPIRHQVLVAPRMVEPHENLYQH